MILLIYYDYEQGFRDMYEWVRIMSGLTLSHQQIEQLVVAQVTILEMFKIIYRIKFCIGCITA